MRTRVDPLRRLRPFVLIAMAVFIGHAPSADGGPGDAGDTGGSGGGEAWRFSGPFGVSVGRDNVVHVAEIGNRRIARFTADGRWLGAITEVAGYGELRGPFDVAIGPDDAIVIADTRNHKILVLNADQSLRFVLGADAKSSAPGAFAEPHFVAVNDAGELFVADTFNARIQKFSPQGEFIKAWGRVGNGPGELLGHGYLASIDVDNKGFVYVREFDGGRIQKYTEDGEYVATFSRRGGGDGELDEGYGLSVIDGKLYCPDTFASRVQTFDLDGRLIDIWAPGEGNTGQHFNHPVDIATTSTGELILTDWKNNRVLKLDRAGNFLTIWGESLGDVLAWQPPETVARPGRGPVKIGIYANPDDRTLALAQRAGVDVLYPSLANQYRDWNIAEQVAKAESMGIEVHPSVACLTFGQGNPEPSDIFERHPEWCLWKKGASEPMGTILSWSPPGARSFRADGIVEQVGKSGVSGVMLDYIRYLGTDYGYDPAVIDGFFREFGVNPLDLPQDDPRWMQYRADFVTDFIVELRHKLAVRQPGRHVEISVYLSGDDPTPGVYLTSSLQDWKTWANMGIVDKLNVAHYTRDLDEIYHAVRTVRQTVPDRVKINSFIACYGGNLNTPELLRKGFEASIAAGADEVTVYRIDAINELGLWDAIGQINQEINP